MWIRSVFYKLVLRNFLRWNWKDGDIKVNIAITGNSRDGKSSLINVIQLRESTFLMWLVELKLQNKQHNKVKLTKVQLMMLWIRGSVDPWKLGFLKDFLKRFSHQFYSSLRPQLNFCQFYLKYYWRTTSNDYIHNKVQVHSWDVEGDD